MEPAANALRPVSIVTASYDTYFFLRLLVEKVREFIGARAYEIIVVDRGSRDGTCEWCALQPDVRLLRVPQSRANHKHGEALEEGAGAARHEIVALLDSDAHPIDSSWLARTADRLDAECRLAGPKVVGMHKGNPFEWFVHPHFMVFFKADLGGDVVLRKLRGETTDTGEEATIRLLERGKKIEALHLEACATLRPEHPHAAYRRFAFGHPHFPTIGGGVFHAWYGTRLKKDETVVGEETAGAITRHAYQTPMMKTLREFYALDF